MHGRKISDALKRLDFFRGKRQGSYLTDVRITQNTVLSVTLRDQVITENVIGEVCGIHHHALRVKHGRTCIIRCPSLGFDSFVLSNRPRITLFTASYGDSIELSLTNHWQTGNQCRHGVTNNLVVVTGQGGQSCTAGNVKVCEFVVIAAQGFECRKISYALKRLDLFRVKSQ